MRKSLSFPLLSSFGTVILLYLIGLKFHLSILELKFLKNELLNDGLSLNFQIAPLPIAIGLVVGFIVERIVNVRNN